MSEIISKDSFIRESLVKKLSISSFAKVCDFSNSWKFIPKRKFLTSWKFLLQIILRKMWDYSKNQSDEVVLNLDLYEKFKEVSLQKMVDSQLNGLKKDFTRSAFNKEEGDQINR